MKKIRQLMIAKREGGLEPFEGAKTRRCLVVALRACGGDARVAEALAQAVELHLRDWSEPRWPSSEYIFRCLRTALMETDMRAVAERLIRHRRHRAAQRRKLSVFDPRKSRYSRAPWRKSAVAKRLERRHGIGHSVSRFLAGEVEWRVLALEYTVVSTTFVSELIRNELLAWGLADAVAHVAPRALGVDVVAYRRPEKEH